MASRIDYRLRPAKHVERKLLCDSFRRLSEFGALETYRYVGFGSFYFSDFSLFHKALGITNMLSIERDEQNRLRFEFNKPYSCITVDYRESNAALPALRWDLRTILWLDYEDSLNQSILTDVRYFCSSAVPGSMLVITVNAQHTTRKHLAESVGEERARFVPADNELSAWGTAKVARRIIRNEIDECLNDRNGGRPQGSRYVFKQLFNFHYSDGAKMLTVGGLLFDEGQQHIVDKCAFDRLPWVRRNDEPFSIETPRLTLREMRYLDRQLPSGNVAALTAEAVPREDVERYAKLYPYFPTYAEADV